MTTENMKNINKPDVTEPSSSAVIGTNRRATKKTENNKITVENLS